MKIYSYINGKVTTADKRVVSAYDIGLLRGYAIYEGITTRDGIPFFLTDHLKRFRKSATELNLHIPLSDSEIADILKGLIQRNKFTRTNFRMILSGGNTIDGIRYNPAKPNFFILSEEWNSLPQNIYKKGGKLITDEYMRFMPRIKTTHYITAVKLQQKRLHSKAIEILYISNGNVLECSTSNIFIFKGNTLSTPEKNVLHGITRLVVLGIAKNHFKIEERNISMKELSGADEIFITSSFKDIVPIVAIDKKTVGKGTVGKNTRFIMNAFSQLTEDQ